MNLKILHLNIERDKHLKAVNKLLEDKKPDIVCFAEALNDDLQKIAFKFHYYLAFAPLLILEDNQKREGEGSAILSRFPIIEVKKYLYGDNLQKKILVRSLKRLSSQRGERAADRFLYNYTLLTIIIKDEKGKPITIATTHFPVVDHTSPGLGEHELKSMKDIRELERADIDLDRFVSKLRLLKAPIIFTADLNNNRGEYSYDTIAHELIDIVPKKIKSTIDPKLHRCPGLKLVVDTIMVSPDISVEDFSMISGVSDHQALLASLKI